MKFSTLFIAAAASGILLAPIAEAVAQDRTRLTVTPRSYLDPGNVVKPGSKRYHDYINQPGGGVYGGYNSPTGFSPPLPDSFSTGEPFRIDFRAPR